MPYEKSAEFARRKAAGQAYPARDAWFPNAPGLGTEWFTAALRGYPYPLKALILWSANPIYGMPGVRRLIERDLVDPKKLPLIISVDPLINESNAFADYIVPDSMMYESWGWAAPWNGIPTKTSTARWPVVEPPRRETAAGEAGGHGDLLHRAGAGLEAARLRPRRPGRHGRPAPAPGASAGLVPARWRQHRFWRQGAVGDATDEDLALSGVARIRPALEATLKPDEWRKVAMLYTRGGRHQPAAEAQDAEHPGWQTHRFTKPLWLWNENVGSSRNALTGKRFSGCATWVPPSFFDGTPVRQRYPQADWPLLIMSFKSPLQSSHTIATLITGLQPTTPSSCTPTTPPGPACAAATAHASRPPAAPPPAR